MTNVTCGLTAKKPGSALCRTLVIEYGTTYLPNYDYWPDDKQKHKPGVPPSISGKNSNLIKSLSRSKVKVKYAHFKSLT